MNDRELEVLRDIRNEIKILRGGFERRIKAIEVRCNKIDSGEFPPYEIDTEPLENTS